MRIAFHTPLNRLDDPAPSGDRRMARQLACVLRGLGHEVEPVDVPRTYLREPDPALLDALLDAAKRQRDHLRERWRDERARPALWFTYHSYYRAPDLLGPALSRELGIPYLLAEASDAARRLDGPWARHAALSREAIAAADLHLCFTARDKTGLAPLCRPPTPLIDLPPFLALGPEHARPRSQGRDGKTLRLLATGMMRERKLGSYRFLASALQRVADLPWTLTLIGDGPMRAEVEACFAAFAPQRIVWRGRITNEAVLEEMAEHDLFVWPGIREAYGLVYLEAQALGLPVLACDSGGVAATVRAGETAILVPDGNEARFAENLVRLMTNSALRRHLSANARAFIREERGPANAAAILGNAIISVTRDNGEPKDDAA